MKFKPHNIFHYLLSTILCALISFITYAQTSSKISGRVASADGKGLGQVSVSLLKAGDSSLVKLAVSNTDGNFEFDKISHGSYLLSFTTIGFQKQYSTPFTLSNGSIAIPPITMSPEAKEMTGVTVQSRRPPVEHKIDRMVVNVDASPTNAGATALEVLEKSPGITVDRDGNISIKGKQGIIVLIDGKQTYLSGQDLANLLRNMPASELDQVEIMTQPSAKYDASGNSGILNLKTKKSLSRGFNGTINLSYVQGRYPKTPNSFAFNYRNSKISFFTNLSYSYWTNFNDQHLTRKFHSNGSLTSEFDQQADQKNHSHNYSGRAGLDYTLNKKTTIGFVVNGIVSPRRWENNGRANILDGNGQLDSFNIVQTINRDNWRNFGVNLNFRRVMNAMGRELSFDFDRIQYNTRSRQTSDNYTYLPDGSLASDPFLLRCNLPAVIKIYSGKADYVHPITKEAKIEAGWKSSLVSTDNDAQYSFFNHDDSDWAVDNTRSNRFKYEENINAAYVNFSRQFKKIGIQTGLRMENTIAKGNQAGNAVQASSKFKKNYTQLFPTAYLSYAANENHQLGLSYGRRIERPNYQDMNPFQYFLDQYTYRQGNPNLTPQFTHNIELSHLFKKSLNTVLSFTSTSDILNDILKQNDQTKVTFQTKENIAKRQTVGLSMSYNKAVKPWWTTSVFVNVNHSHYEGTVSNALLDVSLVSLMSNASQQFRFAKTWMAEVNGFYRTSAQETGLFLIRPMGMVSFGLSKQVMKNKGTLKLNLIDPFYIQKGIVIIDYENIDALVTNRWDNRRVGLNFTYRFSKGQNVQTRRRTSASEEEQNRVGQ